MKTVHALNFSAISGSEFERLVLAFAVRRWPWEQLEWFGQTGDDGGRDLRGTRPDSAGRPERVVIACANWQKLTFRKGKGDLAKIQQSCDPLPDHVMIIGGGTVPASLRTKIDAAARTAKIKSVEVWSGVEFEEHLRMHAQPVLDRFFAGEDLPDDPDTARAGQQIPASEEHKWLAQYRAVFERPAFETPFNAESSLPDFRRALGDVIGALNTGIVRERDGTIALRIPARHAYESRPTRDDLAAVVQAVTELRAAFDAHLRNGTVRPCGCGKEDCPTFLIDPEAARDLDARRRDVLGKISRVVGASVGRAP